MHLQDPESTHTLSRAVQVQSCELIGQFLVLLRNLASKFCSELKRADGGDGSGVGSYRTTKHSQLPTPYRDGGNAATRNRRVCMQNCILLIHRITWLLQTESGHFLQTALELSTPTTKLSTSGEAVDSRSHTGGYSGVTGQYMTTIEQLQSAFDIADTDGDGLVTFDEALEVSVCEWGGGGGAYQSIRNPIYNNLYGITFVDYLSMRLSIYPFMLILVMSLII